MKIAIYSRKSKLTNKGESIENQIEMCKEFAEMKFKNIENFFIYEDEGFSGKNIERPEFKKLLKDSTEKKFDIIICYRLDRISRNVSDFSSTIEELNKYNVNFVSIKEQFDTSTPMGRAMMYIASVFAQLERETIAERVRDNMLELSKTGRWLGGTPPFGFSVNRVMEDGKETSHLVYNEYSETVKLIYDKYLEYESLFKVNKYLLQNNVKGLSWSTAKIGEILRNAYYVKSDESVKKYLELQGSTVFEDSIGNGLIHYNKTNGNRKMKNKNVWIYATGTHEGIINSINWLQVQSLLTKNEKKRNLGTSKVGLFSGLIRCGNCGSIMTVLYGTTRKDGKRNFYYKCTLKTIASICKCNIKNAQLEKLDESIVEKLKKYSINRLCLKNEINSTNTNINKEIHILKKQILDNNDAINNLIKKLASLKSSSSEYVTKHIDSLADENIILKLKINSLENQINNDNLRKLNDELFIDNLKVLNESFETLSFKEKQKLLKNIVKEVKWYGENKDFEITLTEQSIVF